MGVPKEKIKEIADILDTGFRIFIHKSTYEIVSFPDEEHSDYAEMDDRQEEIDKVESDPDSYAEVDKMSSRYSFQIMEDFAASLPENNTRARLFQALEGKKPFANFKIQIDRSGGYRDMWFAFRDERKLRWVERELRLLVESES